MELLAKMNFWGLSYDNIVDMFSLNEKDLGKKILNCMGVPSSFNAIAYQNKYDVTTCSDVYGSDKETLQAKAYKEMKQAIDCIKSNPGRFNSSVIDTPEKYQRFLEDNLKIFFKHYDEAKTRKLYSSEALPEIAFSSHQFDLALCPNFIFNGNPAFSEDFQLNCIKELCRVAHECRIFPILDADGKMPTYITALRDRLAEIGFDTSVETVAYGLLRKGSSMLKVNKRK